MNYWIFKCNPNKYKIDDRLEDPEEIITWQITRYKEDIAPGDLAFIWKTGSERGICAVIEIESSSISMKELDHENKFNAEADDKECFRVLARLKHRFPTISHHILKQFKELKNLSVFHGFQQTTNFSVTMEEGQFILSLIK